MKLFWRVVGFACMLFPFNLVADADSFRRDCKRSLNVEIFATEVTPYPSSFLGDIEVGGSSLSYLYCRARLAAQRLGGDAVGDFSVLLNGNKGLIGRGKAVHYKKSTEE